MLRHDRSRIAINSRVPPGDGQTAFSVVIAWIEEADSNAAPPDRRPSPLDGIAAVSVTLQEAIDGEVDAVATLRRQLHCWNFGILRSIESVT